MELKNVKLGIEHTYLHNPTNRLCYVAGVYESDGACLIVELYDEDGDDITGELKYSEACFLEPVFTGDEA